MTETMTTCLLNPRATWQLSWGRIATWGRPWCWCVQHSDVLIILPFSNWSHPRLHLGNVLIREGRGGGSVLLRSSSTLYIGRKEERARSRRARARRQWRPWLSAWESGSWHAIVGFIMGLAHNTFNKSTNSMVCNIIWCMIYTVWDFN
jgi:hypothetical protein